MSQINHHVTGPEYWRSLEQLAESPQVLAQIEAEFPGYDPEAIKGLSRRKFMKLMAASMALAGITLTGCRRWPKENLVPQTSNPEGRIPGICEHYATVYEINGIGSGLLVTSYDGRPIKIEGNPLHPFSRIPPSTGSGQASYGAADSFAQASVLELYDPDRSRGPMERVGNDAHAATMAAFRTASAQLFTGTGAGIAVLTESCSGVSFAAMRGKFLAKFPQAKWFEYEPISHDNERLATKLAFGQPLRARLNLDKAEIIVSLDADLLGTHPAHTRYANDWSSRRRSVDKGSMSRVYVAETCFSLTGAVADERLPIRPSRLLTIATALATKLGVSGIAMAGALSADETAWVDAAAKDLKAAGKNGVVTVGTQASPEVQAVGFAINAALGSIGKTIVLLPVIDPDRPTHADAIKALAADIQGGKVQTLLILGGNPAYDAPADLEFAKLIGSVPKSIHLSLYRNETSLACAWHLPKAHYLESWGDVRAFDGTLSVQQPLIEPLFGGISSIELLAMLSGEKTTGGREIVREAVGAMVKGTDTEKAFRVVLHDGLLASSASAAVTPAIKTFVIPPAVESQELEVRFQQDPSVYDGRFANSGWLQETPDPLSKLTWDNAALLSSKDAAKLGVTDGDMLKLTIGARSLDIVAFILPGQPVGVIGLPLGYGRGAAGNIGTAVGFDTYKLRSTDAIIATTGAKIEKLGGKYPLSTTQEHHIIDEIGMEGKQQRVGEKHQSGIVIRETTLAEFKQNPRAAQPAHHANLSLQLFDPPSQFNEPHAWGMAVDMTACIGCNACAVACQSENNIPIVGKIEVAANREMAWIRIDRYFKGSAEDENPEVAFQPMMCVHCENAPCEQVCPVAATVHDTEGLNTMVYNRCIGTRYCSNNCPYKVRRFNYFDWHSLDPHGGRFPAPWLNIPDKQQVESIDPIKQMVFNPDVTVRMRGVMEKCTFCVQRISAAKIKAKNEFLAGDRDSEIVADGEVLTACQQACPTQAITFGNLNDSSAGVTTLHKNPRSYSVLEELNTRPRTRHLAKVRNPAEGLDGSAKESEHA